MINWKVRARNKWFWITIVPAIVLLIQTVAAVFGYTLDLADLQGKIIAVIDALFAVLVILGVVEDFTTKGLGDGKYGLSYDEPAE